MFGLILAQAFVNDVQFCDNNRADACRLPARLRGDAGDKHRRARSLPHPGEMGHQMSSGIYVEPSIRLKLDRI